MIKNRRLLQRMDMPSDSRKRIGEAYRAPPLVLPTYISYFGMRKVSGPCRPPASRLHQNVIRKLACNVRADETMPDSLLLVSALGPVPHWNCPNAGSPMW